MQYLVMLCANTIHTRRLGSHIMGYINVLHRGVLMFLGRLTLIL